MKKLLLSLVFGASIASMNAQVLTNGDFEQAASPLLPGVATDCPGWGIGLYTMETANAYAGAQSAKLMTIVDAATAALLQWPSDTIAGVMQQVVTGSWPNAGSLTLNFAYNHIVSAGDTALVACQFADTMGAGPNDDVLLFQALGAFGGNSNGWQTASIPMDPIPGAMGTANSVIVLAASSIGAAFGTGNGIPNSTLWLDNVSIAGGANVIELAASVNVYPNPNNGQFKLVGLKEDSHLEIYSMNGVVVKEMNLSPSQNIDISSLPQGTYLLSISNTKGNKTLRLVNQK